MNKLIAFIDKIFFNNNWTCLVCGREIFNGGYFCKDCFKKLPFISEPKCAHCGRKTASGEEYCLSCKNMLVSVEKARSVFNYERPVSTLIKGLKYNNKRYLAEIFAFYLSNIYLSNYFNSDFIIYVPMYKSEEKRRKFNHSKLLADKLSELINVEVLENVLIKSVKTKNQAKLTRTERLKNLKGSFKLTDKKIINNKNILLIDDVMTTGATAETIAETLLSGGARKVDLLTVASVSHFIE